MLSIPATLKGQGDYSDLLQFGSDYRLWCILWKGQLPFKTPQMYYWIIFLYANSSLRSDRVIRTRLGSKPHLSDLSLRPVCTTTLERLEKAVLTKASDESYKERGVLASWEVSLLTGHNTNHCGNSQERGHAHKLEESSNGRQVSFPECAYKWQSRDILDKKSYYQ